MFVHTVDARVLLEMYRTQGVDDDVQGVYKNVQSVVEEQRSLVVFSLFAEIPTFTCLHSHSEKVWFRLGKF